MLIKFFGEQREATEIINAQKAILHDANIIKYLKAIFPGLTKKQKEKIGNLLIYIFLLGARNNDKQAAEQKQQP